MATDPSHGYEAVANELIEWRAQSNIGVDVVRRWATQLPSGGAVVDIGCGSGVPVSATLVEHGLEVSGVDASPTLVAAFRRRFPAAEVACEAAEASCLFHRKFDGAIAVGLLFLLPAKDQRQVIDRVGRALKPCGRFLFSAPRQLCQWNDLWTGRRSLSLGEDEYAAALERAGLHVVGRCFDEGENHYYDAVRT